MSKKWKLYYGDGSTFSDEDGDFAEAPARNVQALITEDPDVGWAISEGSSGWIQNYIWWPDAEQPWGVDAYGTLDYLVEVGALDPEESVVGLSLGDLIAAGVKIGRTINDNRFAEITKAARADTYFPTKSALRRGERPSG